MEDHPAPPTLPPPKRDGSDFLSGEAGSEQAPTSVLRFEKTHYCTGVLAAVEQLSVGVLVAEEVGDDGGPHGRLLSLCRYVLILSHHAYSQELSSRWCAAWCPLVVNPCQSWVYTGSTPVVLTIYIL